MDKSLSNQLRSAARTAARLFFWIVLALFLLYFLSGIYSVENNEVGVLQFFGEIVDAGVRPGIHYALPWPFYRVTRVPMRTVEKVLIEDFGQSAFGRPNPFTFMTGLNTYAITGDNNLINLECVVQFKVEDPKAYLFNLRTGLGKEGMTFVQKSELAAKMFLREMTCSTIIHCLAGLGVDHALTNRESIVTYVHENLQQRLNAIESGLSVIFVEIKGLQAPAEVQEYFADVINAQNDKKKAINEAESYRFEELPAAHGRSARLRAEAEGYYSEVVQNARGEADRFLKRLSEYRKEGPLTRYRLYMESLQELLPSLGAYHIVDTSNGKKPAKIRLLK